MYIFLIKKEKAEDFIAEFNKNKITDEFLEECLKASILFKKKDKDKKD